MPFGPWKTNLPPEKSQMTSYRKTVGDYAPFPSNMTASKSWKMSERGW